MQFTVSEFLPSLNRCYCFLYIIGLLFYSNGVYALDETKEMPEGVRVGYINIEAGDFDAALKAFDSALLQNNRSLPALMGRAMVFSEQLKHQEAFTSYDSIVSLFPEHAYAWNGRGLAAFNMENFEIALQSFEQATIDKPENGFFYESLAWTYLCRGNFKKAAEIAKHATLMYSQSGKISIYPLLIAYFSYFETGDIENANKSLTYARQNVQSNKWPTPVLDYLEGYIPISVLIGFVENTAEETEAHTYIGLSLRTKGENENAATHINWVREKGDPRVFEYTLARSIELSSEIAHWKRRAN